MTKFNTRCSLPNALRLLLMVGALSLIHLHSASAATYYVSPASSDCTSAAGAGTLASPWQNLFNALTNKTFVPGDIIMLRAGTYRITTKGFSSLCVTTGDSSGMGTVLPIPMQGTSANPIIIQNYPNEDVVVDGTSQNMVGSAWSQCDASSWTNGSFNVGSARTPQIWVNPSSSGDPGTRLIWDSGTDCNGMRPGTFRATAFNLYVRLLDSSNANSADIHMSCQNGDCAWTPVHATGAYVTLRKHPAGGNFFVKYGYYSVRVDGGAHDIVFDGLQVIAAGGRDYGDCVRVADGDNITVRNSLCRESMAAGIAFYGGGPGGAWPGKQVSGNIAQNNEIYDTGFAFKDGGGSSQNNLGMAIPIKNCNNCQVLSNRIHNVNTSAVHITTSTDGGLTSDGIIVDGNEIYSYGILYGGQNRTTTAINIEPQQNGAGGAVRSVTVTNNVIHNEQFVANQGEQPEGIVISPSGHDAPTGVVVVNNSFRNIQDVCLDIQQTSTPIILRNNAFHLCGLNNANQGLVVYANGTAHVHSNNTYWSTNATDSVIWAGGGVSRASVVANWEPSAVQADPQYTSAANLRPLPGSPLIDAGTNTNCAAADRDGVGRPLGARCDIGAFEGSSGVVAGPRQPKSLRVVPPQ